MSYNVLDVCRHVINYSNEHDYGISNLKLQKVLYFIQAYFLTNRQLFQKEFPIVRILWLCNILPRIVQ